MFPNSWEQMWKIVLTACKNGASRAKILKCGACLCGGTSFLRFLVGIHELGMRTWKARICQGRAAVGIAERPLHRAPLLGRPGGVNKNLGTHGHPLNGPH